MKDRIKEIRKDANQIQDVFADHLGLTKNYISLLESGNRVPSDRTISDICREYNVNETWLRTGNGNMHDPMTLSQEIASIAANMMKEVEPSKKTRIIRAVSRLNEQQIDFLYDFCSNLANEKDGHTK